MANRTPTISMNHEDKGSQRAATLPKTGWLKTPMVVVPNNEAAPSAATVSDRRITQEGPQILGGITLLETEAIRLTITMDRERKR